MKRFLFMAAILIAALGFTGCGNSDKGGDLKIDAKVKNGANFNALVDQVRAVGYIDIEGEESTSVIIATADYKNGGFKIKLPKKIEDERLLYSVEGSMPDGITVSNKNAKTCAVGFEAYKNGVYFDELVKTSFNMMLLQTAAVSYLFADSDVKISGNTEADTGLFKINMKIDMNLKKGWNTVYSTFSLTTLSGLISTTNHKIDTEWQFSKDSSSSTIPAAPQKLPKMFKKFFK